MQPKMAKIASAYVRCDLQYKTLIYTYILWQLIFSLCVKCFDQKLVYMVISKGHMSDIVAARLFVIFLV